MALPPFTAALRQLQHLPLPFNPPKPRPLPPLSQPRALIFSPHPDDEVIIGALPLRLARELGWRVDSVAVTLGSKSSRKIERREELSQCCAQIGFGLLEVAPLGFDGINPNSRTNSPLEWTAKVEHIANLLRKTNPIAIFFPHAHDWNQTHLGTHALVMDALAQLPENFATHCFETEFWGAMDDPNLLVESSETDVCDLLEALSFHVGELQRNPYHASLPAWMIDNVRRGAERVHGQGGPAPSFLFGTLYRLSRWSAQKLCRLSPQPASLPCSQSPLCLFTSPTLPV